jgi:hypothetical protein
MPIAINGSGTITGISVGGIPDGTVDTDVLAANAVTYAKIGTTEQGQLCKAWVNFDGTGTVAIRASYNVSSITDNGTGDYTVNFTTAMPDANYTVIGGGASVLNAALPITYPNTSAGGAVNQTAPSTSSFKVATNIPTGVAYDPQYVYLAVFR